jgi:hypothetical protein
MIDTIIKQKYPLEVDLSEASLAYMQKEAKLFSDKDKNRYCYVEKSKYDDKQIFVTLFESGWIHLEKIEGDFVDVKTFFCFFNTNDLKKFINAIV